MQDGVVFLNVHASTMPDTLPGAFHLFHDDGIVTVGQGEVGGREDQTGEDTLRLAEVVVTLHLVRVCGVDALHGMRVAAARFVPTHLDDQIARFVYLAEGTLTQADGEGTLHGSVEVLAVGIFLRQLGQSVAERTEGEVVDHACHLTGGAGKSSDETAPIGRR